MIHRLKSILSVIFLLIFFLGCQNSNETVGDKGSEYSLSAPIKTKKLYTFGVHPLHNPQRLFEVYQPMIDYINEQLKDSELHLEASIDYASFDNKLFSGHFDFALPNPYQTVTAVENGYTIFGKMGDDENFRGIILVRKDSNIKKINDLKGKSISYPAPTALAATMLPQWYFYKHGININKDIKNEYVGSQESSIMSVYLGKTAAAATWPPPWHALIKEKPQIAKEVMIKWETSFLPNNGLVFRNDVPKELVAQISNIIFTLHMNERGRKILSAMELSRYEPADNRTYQPVREFLVKFEREVRPIRLNP